MSVVEAMLCEVGLRAMLHVESVPRSVAWFRRLAERKLR